MTIIRGFLAYSWSMTVWVRCTCCLASGSLAHPYTIARTGYIEARNVAWRPRSSRVSRAMYQRPLKSRIESRIAQYPMQVVSPWRFT
jgi:hypothetical protein